jgi:multicomponent Na+:H+ antiporter subunit E
MTRLASMLWFMTLWVVLWRDVSAANLVSGLVVASVASALPTRGGPRHQLRPIALLKFLAYFCWKLLEANVVLAREVVTPINSIRTGIIAIPLPGYSDFVLTVAANAVSLTPGTLTLEASGAPDPMLYVHVLHLRDLDHARNEVIAIAARAAAAFPIVPLSEPDPAGATS